MPPDLLPLSPTNPSPHHFVYAAQTGSRGFDLEPFLVDTAALVTFGLDHSLLRQFEVNQSLDTLDMGDFSTKHVVVV